MLGDNLGRYCSDLLAGQAVVTLSSELVTELNPRPAGVWSVTRSAGGGGGEGAKGPPWDLLTYRTDFQIWNAIR